MSELRVAVIPVGRVDPTEVESAVVRVSKVLNRAIELRETTAIPQGTEDVSRGQHRSQPFLTQLRSVLTLSKVAKLVGGASPDAPVAVPSPDAAIFVTDVDLYRPGTDNVMGELDPAKRVGLISVRRLREAFYRRKSDPARQRSRLVKQMLRVVGVLQGLPDCRDPGCVMAPNVALADIDAKREKYCAACWRRLSTGAVRI